MAGLIFDCQLEYAAGFRLDAKFSVGDGVTALVGPSGCGKSTTLHLIAGLTRPRAGAIQLGDRALVDTARGIWLKPEQRHVGLVFQDDLLFPHLTVRDNLSFGQRRRPVKQVDFAHLVEVLDLPDLLARYPASLSGGQRQRVALGRAILRGPELLLLDEPLNAQHDELRERIVDYLDRTLREFRIPTLLVAHDLADLDRLVQSTLRMRGGCIVHAG